MSDYVLSAVLRLKDELTGRTKRAQESLNGVKGAAQGAGGGLNNLERDMHRAGSAVNELAGRSDRLKNSLSGIRGDYSPTTPPAKSAAFAACWTASRERFTRSRSTSVRTAAFRGWRAKQAAQYPASRAA